MHIQRTWNKLVGIYCILNLKNGKMYIGSSKNIYDRLHRHRTELRGNRHFNSYLQSSYNKYREESFYVFIVEETELDSRIEREDYYITLLKADYNLIPASPNAPKTDELKEKIRNTLIEGVSSGRIKKQGERKVSVYELDGTFYREYDNMYETAREMKVGISSINRAVRRIHKQLKGYQYFYSDDATPQVVMTYPSGITLRKDHKPG